MDDAHASLVPAGGTAGFAGEPGLQQLASAACHRILHLFGVSGAAVLLAGGGHTQVIAQAGDATASPLALDGVRGLIDRALTLGRAGRTEAHGNQHAHAIVTPLRREGALVKKGDLPTKTCAVCGRPFTWRKKWTRDWENVKYCSKRCRIAPAQSILRPGLAQS